MSVQTMTAPLAEPTYAVEQLPPRPARPLRFLRETALLVGRGLRTMPRVPERLADVTIQPVIFTLLFVYVFGNAIHVPTGSYQDYLLPGLLGQSLAFGIVGAGVATANDFTSGVIDRFRSLPTTRLAIINAQVIGQVLEQILGLTITAGIGLAVGWRPHPSLGGGFALVALMLLALFAFTWFGVLLGMVVRNSDAMQGLGFAIMFPLAFLAGSFVPIQNMDLVPRVIGEWDPLSPLVATVRHLMQGTPAPGGSWELNHPLVSMIGWCVLIVAVCVPLALRRFRTTAAA